MQKNIYKPNSYRQSKNKKSFKGSAIALVSAIAMLSVIAPTFSAGSQIHSVEIGFAIDEKKWQPR